MKHYTEGRLGTHNDEKYRGVAGASEAKIWIREQDYRQHQALRQKERYGVNRTTEHKSQARTHLFFNQSQHREECG